MKPLTPQTATTDEQMRQLVRDVYRTQHCSFIVGAEIVTFVQLTGKIVVIEMPKKEFNRITKWYQGEQ